MATKLKTLTRPTPASATATQISSTVLRTPAVTLVADAGNTVQMYFGESDVSTTKGAPIAPGQSITIQCPQYGGSDDDLLLSDLYIYATTSSQILYVVYLGRT